MSGTIDLIMGHVEAEGEEYHREVVRRMVRALAKARAQKVSAQEENMMRENWQERVRDAKEV